MVNHLLLPPYRIIICNRDGEVFLAVVACLGSDVVRIEVIEGDATRIADVMVRGFWPAPLAAGVAVCAVDFEEYEFMYLYLSGGGECAYHFVSCCTDRMVCGVVKPALIESDSI